MVTRRELDMERNKRLLMDAAIELFAENGYHCTKIDDIVKNAGFSKGTFYNYFKSKEAVLLELMDENINELLSNLESLKQSNLDFRDALFVMTKAKHDFSISNNNFFQLVVVGSIRRGQGVPEAVGAKIHSFMRMLLGSMNDIFEKYMGEYRSDLSTEEVTTIFMSITDSYVHRHCASENSTIEPEKLVDIIFNGITKKER